MGGALLILVADGKDMQPVVSLTEAACERGKRVYVHFSGRGVNLIRDPGFRALEGKAQISACEASFREYGLADQAEAIPGIESINLATQIQHAELLEKVDRHIVL